ncbi:amino acid ABC transporter substrate-binding protein [Mesonia aestuariivivens]|uniref:LysM peptidoglycan-binding domain-containing protein n=1 Tax=Mesonia aestuariivivens TaxID=2796128 RepID=A0ABS6W4W6_9FLAO|nr:LysM peptidoglycan-binding domain-containing protein [Mesonia aestuariivivens]MBW2962859.1 LysM peptidoglycan-binding domain-containing protein [Mesonia aestuariivivens]
MKKNCLFFLLLVLASLQSFAQNFDTHKVEQGETVSSIAKKFNVSIQKIYKYNPDAKKGNIIGTVLVIPVVEASDSRNLEKASVLNFKEYKVKRRETLYSIAKENGISVGDLKKYNAYLYEEELGKGDVIKIPIFTKNDTININNSVQNSSFEHLKHIVLPKEGKMAIARKYGMTMKQLEVLNPEVTDLQPGQVLRVINPKNKDSKAAQEASNLDSGFISYKVKPKENYFRLTQRFNTTKDSLVKYNPILAEGGLKAGMTIKIPQPQAMFSDTLSSGRSSKRLKLESLITNKRRKNIAVMLPFSLEQFKNDSADKEELMKNDKILRLSLDFYSGVVSAIDSVEKMGIPVSAKVFDTEKSNSKLDEILRGLESSKFDAVIGPVLSKNVERTSRFFSKNETPVFSPLIDAELKGEDNLFQSRPSKLMLEKALITYIDSLKEAKKILVLTDNKHEYLKNKLAYTFPNATIIHQAKKEYMQSSDLRRVLSKEKENWVILESDELELVSNATSYLYAMAANYKIRLFTSDKSSPYENEISNDYLSKLNFTYASIAKECEDFEGNSFVKSYVKDYGVLPNKFATRGFDLTYDLLLRLSVADNLYESLELEGVTEHVENKFNYHNKMIGGYYNDAVYLIEYLEDLKLKVIN